MKSNLLFSVFPYIALLLLVTGVVVRLLLLRKHPQRISAEISEAKAVFAGNRLWQISLLLLLVGHGIAMGFPRELLLWNGNSLRLYLLESTAFAVGTTALASWFVIAWRHFKRGGGSVVSELSDTVLLALLFVAICSGLFTAVLYRWGSSWGAITATPYFASLARGRPASIFMQQMPFLVRLHVFSLFAALAVLPVTRLGTVLSAALYRVLLLVFRPLSAIANAIEGWFRRHNPATWLWPEED